MPALPPPIKLNVVNIAKAAAVVVNTIWYNYLDSVIIVQNSKWSKSLRTIDEPSCRLLCDNLGAACLQAAYSPYNNLLSPNCLIASVVNQVTYDGLATHSIYQVYNKIVTAQAVNILVTPTNYLALRKSLPTIGNAYFCHSDLTSSTMATTNCDNMNIIDPNQHSAGRSADGNLCRGNGQNVFSCSPDFNAFPISCYNKAALVSATTSTTPTCSIKGVACSNYQKMTPGGCGDKIVPE